MTKKQWVAVIEHSPGDTELDKLMFLMTSLLDFNWHRDIEDDILLKCALTDLERAFRRVLKQTGDLFEGDMIHALSGQANTDI